MTQLRTCPGCSRHVLLHEQACPFCKLALEPMAERAPLKMAANLSRAQRLTLAAAIAGQAVAACAETAVPVYGAPVAGNVAPTAGSGGSPAAGSGGNSAGRAGNGQAGVGMAVAVYGAPVAGNPGAGPVKDAGTAQPDAATDGDAGPGPKKDAGQMVQPLYGAPIPPYGVPIPPK